MSTLHILTFVFVLGVVCMLIVGMRRWRTQRRITLQLRAEQTRTVFAEARNALLHLVATQEIDVNSPAFQTLYLLQTHVMRRIDQYDQVDEHILAFLARRPLPMDIKIVVDYLEHLGREHRPLGEPVKQIIRQTAYAIWQLAQTHSRVTRVIRGLVMLEQHFPGSTKVLRYITRRRERRDSELMTLRNALDTVNKLVPASSQSSVQALLS